jgi:hypothetical protein
MDGLTKVCAITTLIDPEFRIDAAAQPAPAVDGGADQGFSRSMTFEDVSPAAGSTALVLAGSDFVRGL